MKPDLQGQERQSKTQDPSYQNELSYPVISLDQSDASRHLYGGDHLLILDWIMEGFGFFLKRGLNNKETQAGEKLLKTLFYLQLFLIM